MRYKVSGAIAIPKASWGCAPALPNRIRGGFFLEISFQLRAAGKQKFFDPSNFSKIVVRDKADQTRQRGSDMLAGKSRGGTPFCRTLKTVFPKSRIFVSVMISLQLFPGTVEDICLLLQVSQGGAVLLAPPRKAVAFLTTPSVCQKHGTGISLPAGSDEGYSPWTSPAFLKNCCIKKLLFCLRL